VQIPSLVEAVLQGAAYEPHVVGPGLQHVVLPADGDDIGGAVGEPDAGTGGGGLHHRLGMVGDGVVEALVRRGDAAEGGVVVGAVVETGAASVGRVDHAGHQRRPVGTEDRLGSLDLDLEAERVVGETEPRLEALRGVDHRLDLVHRRHLGQRDHESVRQRTAVGQRLDEQRQGAQPAPAARPFEALEADAVEGRGVTEPDGLAQRLRRPLDVGVLALVVVDGVAVLEVDPEILHRLDVELLAHGVEQVEVTLEQVEEHGLVVVHRPQRPLAVLLEGARVETVGRDVHSVDGLPTGSLPRKSPFQRRVCLVQSGVELRGQPIQVNPRARTVRVRHGATLSG
jgi:hypothetical protein